MRAHIAILLAGAALQLPAGTLLADEGDSTSAAAAPPAAEAQGCIALHRIKSTKVLDDRTILFELNGGETMVNNLPHRCAGLGFEKRFGYKTSISQLCSQDIIWVITSGAGSGIDRGASCGLGKFEPYVAPETVAPAKVEGKLEAQ